MQKPSAAYLLWPDAFDRIYSPASREEIARFVDMAAPVISPENWMSHEEICRDVEFIFSGWGMIVLDEEALAKFPNLRVIFYASGSVREFVTDAMWERGIEVSSAFAANAVPVAEYTVAQIVLATKHTWRLATQVRKEGRFPADYISSRNFLGMFGTTIGLISLGAIGRMVAHRLRDYDVSVVAYDPFVDPADAEALGVKLVSLETLFAESDVVSCHTPWLKETEGMLQYEHFAGMKPNSTFINTARGAVVDEPQLIAALRKRPDISAILDVTYPEPPQPGSPFYELPNVILTPHIAGSRGAECQRMGRYMVEELKRYLGGQPLRFRITQDQAVVMA